MRKAKKWIACLLAAVAAFAAGCAGGDGGDLNPDGNMDYVRPPKTEYRELPTSIVSNGYTEYKLVIPSDDEGTARIAADEFNTFFEESTGVALPVVSDTGLVHEKDNKYISLGDTSLFRSSGVYADEEKLSYSGYVIKRVDNSIYIADGNSIYSEGVIYGVYELLNALVGYKFYAWDGYALEEKNTVKLIDIELEDVPDIPKRSLGFGTLVNNPSAAMRLRVKNYGDDIEGLVGGHSQFDLLNPNIYYEEHPDWYYCDNNGTPQTLCYSNVEMREFLAELLKPIILANPKGRIIQLGQADTLYMCMCDECVTAREEKFMNSAGQQIDFLNQIAEYLDPWVQENCPDRNLRYSVFAYHYSEPSPTVYNEQTGKYEPFSEYVIPRDDVGIYWAPVNMDYSKPIYENSTSWEALKSWSDLLGENMIYMWSYCTNFKEYFVNFNNFKTIGENYRTYAEYGVGYVFDQGNVDSSVCTFEEMRMWVQSQLLWDTSLNVNELVKEFIDFYYGEAANEIYKYFQELQTYYLYLESQPSSGFVGNIFNTIAAQQFWPKGILDHFDGYFDAAYEKIEPLRESEPARFKTLTDRIDKLHMTIDYLLLTNYQSSYKLDEVTAMIEEFEQNIDRFSLFNYREMIPVSELIDSWKQAL